MSSRQMAQSSSHSLNHRLKPHNRGHRHQVQTQLEEQQQLRYQQYIRKINQQIINKSPTVETSNIIAPVPSTSKSSLDAFTKVTPPLLKGMWTSYQLACDDKMAINIVYGNLI